MTVEELIQELHNYPMDWRVVLYSHGVYNPEDEDEILGCYDAEIIDENDNVIEKVVELYEY